MRRARSASVIGILAIVGDVPRPQERLHARVQHEQNRRISGSMTP